MVTDVTLNILNLGDGTLTGDVSILPGASWLSIPGAGAYSIPAGAADLSLPVIMDASSLAEGMYTGTIRVTHNDPNVTNPRDYLIRFFVISDFQCSQTAVLSTGVQ
jgi:hypothetical protein